MKKLASILIVLSLILLTACSGNATPAEQSAKPTSSAVPTAEVKSTYPLDFFRSDESIQQQEADGTLLCRVSFPALHLSQEDALAFPGLSRAITQMNAEAASSAQAAFEQLLPLAQEAYSTALSAGTDGPAAGTGEEAVEFTAASRTVTASLPRADSRAVSVLCSMETVSGSTAGDTFYYSANFDSASGNSLTLGDVVFDLPGFRDRLEAGLRAKYPKADFTRLEDGLNGYMADTTSLTWTLDYQGLSVFFAPGTIAAYEDGMLTYTIRFSEKLSLFNLYYTVTPTAYAVPLIGGVCYDYDLDLDERADDISVELKYARDDSIENLIISVNGKEYTASTPMLYCDMYVVRPGTGASYLFISAQNLTGYGYISVYRLDRSGVSLVGMQYESSLYATAYTSACPGTVVLTDPGCFIMGTRLQYLGTLTGLKVYRTGTDGLPASQDSYYTLYGGKTLTLKRELVTATIDGQGSGTFAAQTFPVGTRFDVLRADGEGAVDVYADDGSFCRLYVSGKPGAQNVNGMPVDDVFEGVEY